MLTKQAFPPILVMGLMEPGRGAALCRPCSPTRLVSGHANERRLAIERRVDALAEAISVAAMLQQMCARPRPRMLPPTGASQ